jgi:hypothetical protein
MFSVMYGQIYRDESCFNKTGRRIMPRTVIVMLVHHRHKPTALGSF